MPAPFKVDRDLLSRYDIPLGDLESAPRTLWSAPGSDIMHVAYDCDDDATNETFDAVVNHRLCGDCTQDCDTICAYTDVETALTLARYAQSGSRPVSYLLDAAVQLDQAVWNYLPAHDPFRVAALEVADRLRAQLRAHLAGRDLAADAAEVATRLGLPTRRQRTLVFTPAPEHLLFTVDPDLDDAQSAVRMWLFGLGPFATRDHPFASSVWLLEGPMVALVTTLVRTVLERPAYPLPDQIGTEQAQVALALLDPTVCPTRELVRDALTSAAAVLNTA